MESTINNIQIPQERARSLFKKAEVEKCFGGSLKSAHHTINSLALGYLC